MGENASASAGQRDERATRDLVAPVAHSVKAPDANTTSE